MSRFGYGSEGFRDGLGGDDASRENGSRRQKMMGYLKAANELRQTYQTQLSQKWQESYGDRSVDTPGAYPDYDLTLSRQEEMVLFPSYARRYAKKVKKDNRSVRPQPSSNNEVTEEPKSPTSPGYLREDWRKSNNSNAIVDVDVRGWLYTPQRGPMSRKHRIMVALARKLSDIPSPTSPIDSPPQRYTTKQEEEDATREAQYLVDKGEHDADMAWKINHQVMDGDSGFPKRVSRASTNSSIDKANVATLNANLMERLKPFMHIPSAETPITLVFYNDEQSQSRTTITNESGHFNVRTGLEFVPTHVRVLASESLSITEELKISEQTGVSLISDIDDTIKHSAITSGAKEMFRNTFIRDFNDLTIDGVKEWYGKLADMGVGIHYVSNAPWQLYPQLKAFFKLAGLPPGSFHLKQYSGMLQGIFEPTAERKRMSLEKIIRDFPERKFILVGDSGEADLEVYTELVQQNPGKILGVFIRDVTTVEKRDFFDHSFAQKRSGYSMTDLPLLRETSEVVEKRPPLPPRKPISAQTINNGDLMTFDDESSSDDIVDSPVDVAAKAPPTKPSKPFSLQTAATIPVHDTEITPQSIQRKPAPPLPNKPVNLSSPNVPAKEASNQAPSRPTTSKHVGPPPPVPPARRGNISAFNLDERKYSYNNISSTPRKFLSRQSTQSSLASNSTYYDYTGMPSPSSPPPILNKREELWKRRWERAQQILSDSGVLLGSWRVGSDVQDITVWVVENALRKGHT